MISFEWRHSYNTLKMPQNFKTQPRLKNNNNLSFEALSKWHDPDISMYLQLYNIQRDFDNDTVKSIF